MLSIPLLHCSRNTVRSEGKVAAASPKAAAVAAGTNEDVITDLSKIAGLMVISRNSSFTYDGRSIDIRDIGRDLGVRSVLEGSIRRAGNRVKITAQLIDATNGAHLWADRYDRDLTDIFAVQDDVTRQIVHALKVTFVPPKRRGSLTAGRPTSMLTTVIFAAASSWL